MNLADLPLALSLLLPGFLLLHVVFLVSRIRRISAFHATTWSLFISLLLFMGVYAVYSRDSLLLGNRLGFPFETH